MNTSTFSAGVPRKISAQRTVSRHLTLFVLLLLGALAASVLVMVHIARVQDDSAREQARFYVGKALQNRMSSSESLLKSFAFWNDAYRNLKPPLNLAWAGDDDHLGPDFYATYGYDMVCVRNLAGEEYVMRRGRPAGVRCAALLSVSAEVLRAGATEAARRDSPFSTYALFDGEPAIVSAALVRPTPDGASATYLEDGPLMLFVDQLTPSKLQKLARDYGLDSLQAQLVDTRMTRREEMPLGDSGAEISWTTPTPGSDMLHRVASTWLAVLALFGVVLVWLIRAALANARVVDHYQHSLKLTNQALEVSEERFKAVAEASSDWIWEIDGNYAITYLSARFETLTGYRIADWLGRRIDDLISCDTTSLIAWLDKIPHEGHSSSLTCSFRDSHGLRRICKFSAADAAGRGFRGTSADITQEVEAHARIQHLSLHDALTGLPNRSKLASFMDELLADQREQVALLVLDLDRFKSINDSLGHPAGDAVLQVIAERLRSSIRGEDLVARMGGDEFVIVDSQVRSVDEVEGFCRRLVELINRPIEHEGQRLHVGTSIGIALSSGGVDSAEDLLRRADVAMYNAKTAGRNSWRFYARDMDQLLRERKRDELELREALRGGQLELHYQPRYRTRDRRIVSAEALVRWNHPRRGLLDADAFIVLAEESGLIVEIGEWVLREACRAASGWPHEVLVSVNIAPTQFVCADIVEQVQHALVESGLAAERLELEVTENVMLNDVEGALQTMLALKALGVRLNMDDFGTGYSSLGYLRAYPFDSIKIDRRFIAALGQGGRDRSVVQAIIGLGKALNLSVTAEGVETEEQLRVLEREACNEVQGFLFSRPLRRRTLEALLRRAAG